MCCCLLGSINVIYLTENYLQGHPITETTTITHQQTKTTVGCYKTTENKFMTAEKLSVLAWSKTDQEGKLIGPRIFTWF